MTKSLDEIQKEVEVLTELVLLMADHLPREAKAAISMQQEGKIMPQAEFEALVKRSEKALDIEGKERAVRIRYLLNRS